MAVESAVILARLLGENEPSDELFERFTQLRRPRTDKVTKNARRGLLNLGVTGFRGLIRDIVVWLLGSWFYRNGMRNHYDYDASKASLSI
jgi:2-polyprenyl-6-methoxyphenol hydroxylase-like FAD-dependent oxidoreductase